MASELFVVSARTNKRHHHHHWRATPKPDTTNNTIIHWLTQRLLRQRLSIPDYTRATSALHGFRSSAAEATPLLAAASVAERRLLRFSADSGTALVLG